MGELCLAGSLCLCLTRLIKGQAKPGETETERTRQSGLEVVERRLMDLVPAPAVRLMKSRVKSRPGVDSVQLGLVFHFH